MVEEELCYRPLTEVAEMVRDREISAFDLTEAVLRRIDRLGPQLNCFITVTADRARHAAQAMDILIQAGIGLGPLQGVPLAVKDDLATAGVRTTAGSAVLSDSVPSKDATVVARLATAGGVVVGKNNMYDFAYNGPNPKYGPTHNPWDLERTCGGSSSGSASAVAGGLCFGAIGSDAGGSIRIPASLCGIVGLKPTFGLVSRAGAIPLCPTLAVLGPLTRTVRDAALLLQVIAGHDGADSESSQRLVPDYSAHLEDGVRGLRLAAPHPDALVPLDPEVARCMGDAYTVLTRQGATLVEVDLPDFLMARAMMWAISGAEVAEYLRPYLRTRPGDFHPVTLASLQRTEFISATQYLRAQRMRRKMMEDLGRAMAEVDAIVLPTLPISAYTIGTRTMVAGSKEDDVLDLITRYTTLFSLTGLPAITVPCGFTSLGLPVGLQVAGAAFDEATVLRVARAYERETEWHRKIPFATAPKASAVTAD